MVEAGIERAQTDAEKQDFVLIGTRDYLQDFSARLADVQLEFVKSFKPFDLACARLDFIDKVEQAERESQRTYGFVKEGLKIESSDLAKYGKEDRFILEEDKEEREEVLVNGLRTWVISGHTLSYRCKNRGHGVSVFVPIADYNEKFAKKK